MHVSEIRDRIDHWLEDAGIHGLCRDGQREFALDRLITEYPRMERRTLIRVVDERLRALTGHERR